MARALRMSRTTVAAPDEPAYLEARRAEAARVQAQGDSFWLFRHETAPGVYLEFHESRDRARLAAADPSAEVWAEVPLDGPTGE